MSDVDMHLWATAFSPENIRGMPLDFLKDGKYLVQRNIMFAMRLMAEACFATKNLWMLVVGC
jgi:hypothetical protein